jgi:hypothetical protein
MKMLEWISMAHFPGHPHSPSPVYISVMILPTVYVYPFCCCQTDGHEELKKMRRKSKQWMKQIGALIEAERGLKNTMPTPSTFVASSCQGVPLPCPKISEWIHFPPYLAVLIRVR